MPGFVKTSRDEAAWQKAKEAAFSSYPRSAQARKFAAANAIFHKMKDGSKRSERHGNPGKEIVKEQFPSHSDKPFPFSHMEKRWHGSSKDIQKQAEVFYSKGEAKNVYRQVPIGKGGEGGVVGSSRHSSLARAKVKGK